MDTNWQCRNYLDPCLFDRKEINKLCPSQATQGYDKDLTPTTTNKSGVPPFHCLSMFFTATEALHHHHHHRVSLPLTQLKQVLRLFKGKYKFSFWSRSRSFLDFPLIPANNKRMGGLCSRVELRCYPPPVAAVLPLFLLRQELYTHFVCVSESELA